MARLPSLNALRAFEAVARHLSFQAAASELSVTPAALSHQIKGLEADLGMPLFFRHTRSISLTPAGETLYPGIRSGFESFQTALRRLRQAKADNILVVSAGPAFTAKWLAPRLYRFATQYPGIDARVSANLAFSDFVTDDVDIALRFGMGNYDDLFVEHLLPESTMPLCSPALAERIKEPRDLADLPLIHDESLEYFSPAPDWDMWLAEAGVDADMINTKRGLRFNLADHALDAARDGAGVVLGRRVLAQADMDAGRLVAPFSFELDTGLSFYLVCPTGSEEREKVRAFRAWMRDEVNEGDGSVGGDGDGESEAK